MFLAVVSAGVVIYEKLPKCHCENRRELGAQASSCEPRLSSLRKETAPTLPHPSPVRPSQSAPLQHVVQQVYLFSSSVWVILCENTKQKYLHMFV